MADLSRYIKEILQDRNSVILPELGGFTAKYQNARYDEKTQVFLPPSKKVVFNTYLTYNDEVLQNYLIQKEPGTTAEEAKKSVEDFVNEVTDKLKTGEKVEFEGIGYLEKNPKGTIILHPKIEENLLLDSYGMEPLKVMPVHKSREQAKNMSEKKKNGIAFTLTLIFTIIVLSGAVMVFFFPEQLEVITSKLWNPKTPTDNGQEGYKIGHFEDTTVEVNSLVSHDTSDEFLKDTLDASTSTRSALYYKEPIEQRGTYYLVAGTFSNYKNAELLSGQLVQKGYNVEIIESGEKLYKVTIGKYELKSRAMDELTRLNASNSGVDVWVWTNKGD